MSKWERQSHEVLYRYLYQTSRFGHRGQSHAGADRLARSSVATDPAIPKAGKHFDPDHNGLHRCKRRKHPRILDHSD